MITLDLATARQAPETICTGCRYAHVVRGFLRREELIFCGYAFPQRQVPFPVRACTDFRQKRERSLETVRAAVQS